MARKPMDMPAGVEIHSGAVRIRFTWNGTRHRENLSFPATQKGISAAAKLRDQVVQLIKLGLMDDAKYAELFPGSVNIAGGGQTFGQYAQLWLDSRDITAGTRNNYKGTLNLYWMPRLALTRVDLITTTMIRRILTETEWSSPGVKRNALVRLSTILKAAVHDGLIPRNPAAVLELPKRSRKEVDPFTLDDANRIIAQLYRHEHWPSTIYAALFEFLFFTGLRISEALALRWDAIDLPARQMHVCRTVAQGEVVERTKTGAGRFVLLNDRALHALQFAKQYAQRRKAGVGKIKETPYVFPPSKNNEHVKQTSDVHHQWKPALKALGIRHRPPYNCRHTYATICLMSGMNPAFIAGQLGHSVQMLLSTYARWISSQSDWNEIAKLQIGPKLAPAAIEPA